MRKKATLTVLKGFGIIAGVTIVGAVAYCWLSDGAYPWASEPITLETSAPITTDPTATISVPQATGPAVQAPTEEKTPRQIAREANARGRELYNQGEYREAYKWFRRAAKAGSNDGERSAQACRDRLEEEKAAGRVRPKIVAVAFDTEQEAHAKDWSGAAISEAKIYVMASMKTPFETEFAGVECERDGDTTYRVTGLVTSKNSYGAKVTNTFTVVVKYVGKWGNDGYTISRGSVTGSISSR